MTLAVTVTVWGMTIATFESRMAGIGRTAGKDKMTTTVPSTC